MFRHTTFLALLLAAVLSLVLFTLKHQVQELESELAQMRRSVFSDRQALRVLNAEWSHLNDPTRLRALAKRYLDLEPVEPSQLGTLDDLPDRPPQPGSHGLRTGEGLAPSTSWTNGKGDG